MGPPRPARGRADPRQVAEEAEALAHVLEALRDGARRRPRLARAPFYTRDPLRDVVQPAPLPELTPAPDGQITGEQALEGLGSLEVARAEDGPPGCSTSSPPTS